MYVFLNIIIITIRLFNETSLLSFTLFSRPLPLKNPRYATGYLKSIHIGNYCNKIKLQYYLYLLPLIL